MDATIITKFDYFLRLFFIKEKYDEMDWYQFFTLRYNSASMFRLLIEIENDLYARKKFLLEKFALECCQTFINAKDIRLFNSIQAIFDLLLHTRLFLNPNRDVLTFIIGNGSKNIVQNIADRLVKLIDSPSDLSEVAVHFLVSIISAANVPSLVDAIVSVTLYDSLCGVLKNVDQSFKVKQTCLLLINLLVRSCKSDNDFTRRWINEQDEQTLEELCNLIGKCLIDSNAGYQSKLSVPYSSTPSVWHTFAHRLSNLLYSIHGAQSEANVLAQSEEISILLALLNGIRHNQCFVQYLIRHSLENVEATEVQTNVISFFLTYCSFMFNNIKSDYEKKRCAFGLLILISMMRNIELALALHSSESNTSIILYHSPTLFRVEEIIICQPNTSLADAICELICEFMTTHMYLNFPFEIYRLTVDVVHRLIVHAKKQGIRMSKWRLLYEALLSLLNFVTHNHRSFNNDAYSLCLRIVVILNLFITYGDTFLPNDVSYDFMCYEILRRQSIFLNLSKIAIETRDSMERSDDNIKILTRLIYQLENPLEIVNHFKSILSNLDSVNPSEQEIFCVIRSNFHTLQLKLYDGLELFEQVDFILEQAITEIMEFLKKDVAARYGFHGFDFPTMLILLPSVKQ